MKSEKRMVGDYTVLCAVNIGSREIILAENEQDKNGERFLCCYVLTGEASWSPGSGTAATTPFPGDDFMAIRWGGDNEYLKAHTDAFMGMYNDKSRIPGYSCVSYPYSGYCWSFDEQSGSKIMDSATAMVMMRTTYPESQNRETGATFIYVHTYEELSVSASVSFSGGNYTGGLTVTGCSKQWQLAVSVDTIKF